MTLRCNRLSGLFDSNPAPIAPQTKAPPALVSTFGCAIDVTTGRVLYTKAANTVYEYPASTVKMMTMLLVAEMKGAALSSTVTWQASDDLDSGFSQVGFNNGDVVTWNDLLHGMMMVSGGDACQAAARVIGNEALGVPLTSTDGYAKFTEMMNARAKQLGCRNTAFSNAHGAEKHIVTARDMARITGSCFRNAVISALSLDTAYAINITGPNARTINITNTNPMLSVTGVKGSKTGSLSGGAYPTTYSLGTLWTTTGGKDIALYTMFSGTSADRYTDVNAMIAALPTDFPYLN